MNELSLAFTVGVIASLFSIFVSIVLSAFWKKNILPWYEERLYQGAEISGEWTTLIKYSAEIENEVIYVVKRTGYNIHGYAYCINGSDKGMNWVLDGAQPAFCAFALAHFSTKGVLSWGRVYAALA